MYITAEAQVAKAPPSIKHSKVAPDAFELNVKAALVLVSGLGGEARIVVPRQRTVVRWIAIAAALGIVAAIAVVVVSSGRTKDQPAGASKTPPRDAARASDPPADAARASDLVDAMAVETSRTLDATVDATIDAPTVPRTIDAGAGSGSAAKLRGKKSGGNRPPRDEGAYELDDTKARP